MARAAAKVIPVRMSSRLFIPGIDVPFDFFVSRFGQWLMWMG